MGSATYGGRSRSSLLRQFNLLTIGSIVLTAVVLAGFVTRQEMVAQSEQLRRHAEDLARIMALNSTYAVYTEDESSCQHIAESLMDDEDVIFSLLLS